MIKYNNSNINDWNFDDSNIVKVYHNNAIVFYKFDTESQEFKVCFAVVEDISQYSDREFEDVYDKATEKWYKLNNLNAYEEYGVYGSGRTSCEGSSRLPQGYTEVEYIRQNSNYNAYINTGVIPFDNTSNTYTITTRLTSEFHSNLGCATIIACENPVSTPAYYGLGYRYKCSSAVDQLEFYGSYPNYSSSVVDNGDGTRTVTFQSTGSTSWTLNTPLIFFANWASTSYDSIVRPSDTTIYSSTVVKNGITVRDFVPAKRNSDSVYGLYDLINDVFYTSPNGNNFIGGDPVTPTDCVTTYNGKLTVDDGYEYEWNGSSWVNLGEVSGGTVVPQGYTEVEYIENTGTSYINTNFTPNQDTRLLADMQVVTYNTYGCLFGAGNHGIANSISCDYNSNGNLFEVSWGGVAGWTQYTSEANYNKRTYDWNKNYLYVDGNLIGSSTYTTFTCQNKLGIFNVLENADVPTSNTGRYFYGRVYSFKIYDNSQLVIDFIPAKRKRDYKYGLYDSVNDVFYVSPNNTNFIGGAETGTTEYPKYYEEKSEPLDNLNFNTMEDAISYAYNNCVYDGMKATIDGNSYYFDSTDENGWVEDTSYTIWLDPSATNALFSIGHYWGENYKMVFTMYFSGSYSGDRGSFWQVNGHSPIELSFYSNGFYYDMHNPTSTTAPDVRTTDYDYRILRQNAFSSYENSQKIKITLTYGSFKAELAETGSVIYSSGSTRTGYSWYNGLYQANVGINNAYSTCHLSHIEVYNANNQLVNDLKFIKNSGVVGAQEISLYDSITKTTYNNTTSNTPVYHIET